MKSSQIKYHSVQQQDTFFQDRSSEELKDLIDKLDFNLYVKGEGVELGEKSEFSDKITDVDLEELKQIMDKKTLTIDKKMELTGLTSKKIHLIENDKYKATLEEIISYCAGLNIRFMDFVPELFS